MTFDHHTQLIRAARVRNQCRGGMGGTSTHVLRLAWNATRRQQRRRLNANKVQWSRVVCTIKHVEGEGERRGVEGKTLLVGAGLVACSISKK